MWQKYGRSLGPGKVKCHGTKRLCLRLGFLMVCAVETSGAEGCAQGHAEHGLKLYLTRVILLEGTEDISEVCWGTADVLPWAIAPSYCIFWWMRKPFPLVSTRQPSGKRRSSVEHALWLGTAKILKQMSYTPWNLQMLLQLREHDQFFQSSCVYGSLSPDSAS